MSYPRGNKLTARNEALLRTEKSLKLFRALIDQSNDGVTVMDPETGRFLNVNEKTCERLGYSREEMLLKSVPDIEAIAVTHDR
jgi:PAS domain S-box-containing protein